MIHTFSAIVSRRSTWVLFAVVSIIPFFFADIPPLTDLPGHLGRYEIMLGGNTSPFLKKFYEYKWFLTGNLGADAIIWLIGPALGVERATWLVAASIPPLTVGGIAALAGVIHGRIPPTATFALLLVYSYPFSYGFLNYSLGCAIALYVLALWIRTAAWSPYARVPLFALCGVLIWLCHAAAWGILGLAVAGFEVGRLGRWREAYGRNALSLLLRILPLCLPVAPTLLWAQSHGDPGVVPSDQNIAAAKVQWLASIVRDSNIFLDGATAAFIVMFAYSVIRQGKIPVDRGIMLSSAAVLLSFLIMPPISMGSYFADMRILPMVFIIFFCGIKGHANRHMIVMSWGSSLLFLIRILATSANFHQYDLDWKNHLQALRHVEKGSRILVLYHWKCPDRWRSDRLQNFGNLAILYKEAFVNTQWSTTGAHPIEVKYNVGNYFSINPSQFVFAENCDKVGLPREGDILPIIPSNRFDYIWLFNWSLDDRPDIPGSRLLFQDERTALLSVKPEAR